MLGRFLLLAAPLSFTLSAALAQSQPRPSAFPRYPARQQLAAAPAALNGGVPPAPAGAPIPTVRAAAAYAAGPHALSQPLPAAEPPSAPRRDVTGVQPAYDLYQNLPEDFRKRTLPAPWAEPLPLQLLRGALGR
ncbi:MAG: hypothetical protein EOO59_07950 [Hymenobacter sp.]|nr:MAG: hypothetical protein EOO59_07950 [Hymenobacter sp.]